MKRINKQIIVRKNGSTQVKSLNDEVSMVAPEFQDQSNINNIMKRYRNMNSVPNFAPTGHYMDTTNVKSYHESLNIVLDAQTKFQQLPSDIRKRFSNNPEELLQFLGDKNNKEEAIKLGLINPPTINTTIPQPLQNEPQNQNTNETKTPKQKTPHTE